MIFKNSLLYINLSLIIIGFLFCLTIFDKLEDFETFSSDSNNNLENRESVEKLNILAKNLYKCDGDDCTLNLPANLQINTPFYSTGNDFCNLPIGTVIAFSLTNKESEYLPPYPNPEKSTYYLKKEHYDNGGIYSPNAYLKSINEIDDIFSNNNEYKKHIGRGNYYDKAELKKILEKTNINGPIDDLKILYVGSRNFAEGKYYHDDSCIWYPCVAVPKSIIVNDNGRCIQIPDLRDRFIYGSSGDNNNDIINIKREVPLKNHKHYINQNRYGQYDSVELSDFDECSALGCKTGRGGESQILKNLKYNNDFNKQNLNYFGREIIKDTGDIMIENQEDYEKATDKADYGRYYLDIYGYRGADTKLQYTIWADDDNTKWNFRNYPPSVSLFYWIKIN